MIFFLTMEATTFHINAWPLSGLAASRPREKKLAPIIALFMLWPRK